MSNTPIVCHVEDHEEGFTQVVGTFSFPEEAQAWAEKYLIVVRKNYGSLRDISGMEIVKTGQVFYDLGWVTLNENGKALWTITITEIEQPDEAMGTAIASGHKEE